MWVAASLKVQVYLKFELIRVHMGWPNSHKTIKQEPPPPSQPHTHTHTTKTKGTTREIQSRSKLKKKKKKKEKRLDKTEGWRLGNGRQHGKISSEDGIVSFLLLTFSIFFKFLVPPNFHFSAEMSNIRRYVRYSLVRTSILSNTNHGCFYTGSPAGTINSSRNWLH